MSPKLNFFSGLATILALLCIAWQYTVFEQDHRELLKELSRLEKAHGIILEADLLPDRQEEITTFSNVLHEKIPEGDAQDEHLLRTIRTTSLINNCSYHLFEKRLRSRSFYNEKQVDFKISGQMQNVEQVLTEIEQMKRLINWTSLCTAREPDHLDNVEITVSLTMYHFPWLKFRQISHLEQPRLITKTWLPPFSFQLEETKEKAESIYDLLMATPQVEEHIQLFERYTWSRNRLLQKETILEDLETLRSPLAPGLENISRCFGI